MVCFVIVIYVFMYTQDINLNVVSAEVDTVGNEAQVG